MSYIVDIAKSPETLLREMFNHDNGTEYTSDELMIVGVPRKETVGEYNASIIMEVSEGVTDADVREARIYYNRMDIGSLFPEGLDVGSVYDPLTGLIDNVKLMSRAQEELGLYTTDGLDSISLNGRLYLRSLTTNLALHGSVAIVNSGAPDYHWLMDGVADEVKGGVTLSVTGTKLSEVAGRAGLEIKEGMSAVTGEIDLLDKSWTFSTWYNPNSFDTYTHLFTGGISQGDVALKLMKSDETATSGTPFFHTRGSGSLPADISIPLNEWTHLTYVYETSGRIRIFINGVNHLDMTITPVKIRNPFFAIGTGPNGECGSGHQSDSRLYMRVLSDEEILELASNT